MRETRIKLAFPHCFALADLKVWLSHFVAKFANVLKVPSVVVDSGRDKNATKPMTATPPDSLAETDEFLRKQAEFEAAYRTTGDPQVLCHALVHTYSSGRPPPPAGWCGAPSKPWSHNELALRPAAIASGCNTSDATLSSVTCAAMA